MKNRIVLEIGSSDGFDTERLLKRFGLPIYAFEPVPELFEYTTDKFKQEKLIHITNAAVDIEDGTKDFYLSNPEGNFQDGTNRKIHPYGCSSLYDFADDLDEKWPGRPDFVHIKSIKTSVVRLDTFLDNLEFSGEIAYIHCDAQGNDVNVLKSLGKYLPLVKEGVIEVAAKTQLYKGTNNTADYAQAFLRSNGFQVTTGNNNQHEMDIRFSKL